MKGDSRVIGALTQCALFYGRPIHALVPTCALRHFAGDQTIYRPGDDATHLVVLLGGRAELLDGAGRVRQSHRAPEVFGVVDLFARNRKRHVTARAAGDVDTVLVPRDALVQAAAADLVIMERLLSALADATEPAPVEAGSPARRPRPRPTGAGRPLDM